MKENFKTSLDFQKKIPNFLKFFVNYANFYLLQCAASQKRFENGVLEVFDDVELASALQFETLQLGQRAVQIEHSVSANMLCLNLFLIYFNIFMINSFLIFNLFNKPFLQFLALLFRGRQNHALIGAIDLEKSIFFS